jgi:hypothetical protein
VGLIPLFLVAEALVRVRVSLNRVFDLSFTDTLSVFGMWFASKFSNTWAALRGTAGETMPFVRTPKGAEGSLTRWGSLRKAVGLTPFGRHPVTCRRVKQPAGRIRFAPIQPVDVERHGAGDMPLVPSVGAADIDQHRWIALDGLGQRVRFDQQIRFRHEQTSVNICQLYMQ